MVRQCTAEQAAHIQEIAPACSASTFHTGALAWAIPRFVDLLVMDARLPGLDWAPVLSDPDWFTVGDEKIHVFECAWNPTKPPDAPPAASMNAFALTGGVWMLDPLMNAMAEAAVVYDMMLEEAGGSFDSTKAAEMWNTVQAVYANHTKGLGWSIVDWPTTQARLETSSTAWEMYLGQVTFAFYHELAHSNLMHGPVKCLVRGLLSDRERTRHKADIKKFYRSTEAQADIYAVTMLKSLGFGADAPWLLVAGFMGMTWTGCYSKYTYEPVDFDECMLGKGTLADHPPNDERALIIQKIMVDGQDLTGFLDGHALGRVRDETCGNGICGTGESASSCPADCVTNTCGDGVCSAGETAGECPTDCAASMSCAGIRGVYDAEASCVCDDLCLEYDDCCPDFEYWCGP